jgi:hypothetical protein
VQRPGRLARLDLDGRFEDLPPLQPTSCEIAGARRRISRHEAPGGEHAAHRGKARQLLLGVPRVQLRPVLWRHVLFQCVESPPPFPLRRCAAACGRPLRRAAPRRRGSIQRRMTLSSVTKDEPGPGAFRIASSAIGSVHLDVGAAAKIAPALRLSGDEIAELGRTVPDWPRPLLAIDLHEFRVLQGAC